MFETANESLKGKFLQSEQWVYHCFCHCQLSRESNHLSLRNQGFPQSTCLRLFAIHLHGGTYICHTRPMSRAMGIGGFPPIYMAINGAVFLFFWLLQNLRVSHCSMIPCWAPLSALKMMPHDAPLAHHTRSEL
jgi:hypothetical protein